MKEFGTKALITVERTLLEVDGLLISKLEIKCRKEITFQFSQTSKKTTTAKVLQIRYGDN